MTTASILTKLKSSIRKLLRTPPIEKERPYPEETTALLVGEIPTERLFPAVIDVHAREVIPELVMLNYTPGDTGFQSMVYRNRLEQMYCRIRKAKKDTFTLLEAQLLSGIETDMRPAVAHLIDKGFVVRTSNKRYSKIYNGKPGRPALSERKHLEYRLVKSRHYVGLRTGHSSAAVWG